ncbi:MAG: type IV pilus assembly protein PilM [Arenicellales bacterium]
MFGSRKSNQFIGVDIGESAVKLVQLERNGQKLTVQKVAIEPLHRGLFVEGQILDPEQIGSIIENTLKQNKFTAKQAISCVNYSDVISKRLMVRADLRDRELEQWIEFEVDKFVPFPVADLNIDYQLIGDKTDNNEREVQVVACRKKTIDALSACVEFSSLTPVSIDIVHHAFRRASAPVVESMAGGGISDLTAIVDVGMSSMRFYVFDGDAMIYQREEAFGGGILIDDISSEYSMSEDKAHLAIYRKQLPASYREKVLKPYVKTMLKEIDRGILSFESTGMDGQVARILLAGGSARVGGLAKILNKRVRLDVKLLDSTSYLKLHKSVDAKTLRSQAPQIALACGLAMWTQD